MNILRLPAAAALLVAFACTVVTVSAAVKDPGAAACPVSGKKCNPEASADYAGGKVWFCCGNCAKAFTGDPTKFSAKAHQQMASTGQLVQKGCPFSGATVKAGTQLAIGDAEVGFCCNNCKGKVEKASPDEQVNMVFGNIAKGFAPAK